MYKSKLQEYCQSKAWNLPEYSISKEGVDHCPQFKAKVIVNGISYFTPDSCKSSKEAQNVAAKLAFDKLCGEREVKVYKSKLQELCQSKGWKLPEYATTKEGLDHCPQFKCIVTVNGVSYSTPNSSKSSKEAQNMVAKLAFDNLCGSLNTCNVPQPQTPGTFKASSLSEANSTIQDNKKDMTHLYKNQLQTYAQKRNLVLPVYSCEREGPPHSCRFKSKVILEGKTYEGPDHYNTIKDADNAAAKVALMSLSSDGIEEENPSFFKNLLQELTQREYSCLPEYNTSSFGASHMPKFISTVEIKGELFRGQEAKTKKLAEVNVAKVAYTALKERQSKQNLESYSTGYHHVKETPEVQSAAVAELSQGTSLKPASGSTGTSMEDARFKKGKSLHKDTVFKDVKEEPEVITYPGANSHFLGLHKDTTFKHVKEEPEVITYPGANFGGPKSPDSHTSVQSPSPSRSESSSTNTSKFGQYKASFPSYKKIQVYPYNPNMIIPPNTSIMLEDKKWVAVTASMDSNQNNS